MSLVNFSLTLGTLASKVIDYLLSKSSVHLVLID